MIIVMCFGKKYENGVLVKINVIELRSPQVNLFLAKMIVLDFTGVCFDAIMQPDRVTSKKAETSVTENPGNKGIWVEGYSHKSPFPLKFIIIRDVLHGYIKGSL